MDLKARPKRKLTLRSGVKQLIFCKTQRIFLAVNYDKISVYDADIEGPLYSLKLACSPKFVALSPCGKYFCVHQSSNNLYLYQTSSGIKIQKILGAPFSTKNIKFSGDSRRIIFGSTQMLCLWSLVSGQSLMRTQFWRNINCYDINHNGHQFALGTYNGGVFVLDFVQRGRCNQIQIKRHKNCIMCICFHKKQLLTASHDYIFIISTINSTQSKQKTISYVDLKMSFIPKQIKSVGDRFYLFSPTGMTWFTEDYSLVGFTDSKSYSVFTNEDNQLIFVKYWQMDVQWWHGSVFKPISQKEKENRRVVYYKTKVES